jgi:large subunit ribosomal protein L25
MEETVLQAEKREMSTKGTVRAMRRSGRVPAVAYGDNEAPIALSVDEKSVLAILKSERGRNSLINLKIGESAHPVLLKEIQRHPITRSLRHVDFYRISLKQKIETTVPVHVKGEAPGVKLGGGILEHVLRDLKVRCLATEIPSSVDADVSALQVNQGIKAKDLPLPNGVELLIDPEAVIVNIVPPTILEETPAPGAAAAAAPGAAPEPEVIKKGKTDEEGAAAAGDKKPGAAGDKKPAAAAAKPEGKKEGT